MLPRFSGLPIAGTSGPFLVQHGQFGLMLAEWQDHAGCFYAVGFSGIQGMPVTTVAVQAEQVPLIEWHSPIAFMPDLSATTIGISGEGSETTTPSPLTPYVA